MIDVPWSAAAKLTPWLDSGVRRAFFVWRKPRQSCIVMAARRSAGRMLCRRQCRDDAGKQSMGKPIIFTSHALLRMKERGTTEHEVLEAIRVGRSEPAREGRVIHRLNVEFRREWDGKYYGIQQIAPVTVEEDDRIVVITVF
ncbi:MAG TPA: DUF4258 domain-containing protein, partial [bacterium]|nr:DUF4258 domain-containing protein [bacterium]